MFRQGWLFAGVFLLATSASAASYEYQLKDGETVYLYDGDVLSHLPDVNYVRLSRIADLSRPENKAPLVKINPDYWYCEESCEHAYVSDGRYVLWAGKIIRNPENTPRVDAATFQAFGEFAADKKSLYFNGERTDSNLGDKRVDMATLEATEIYGLLKDKNNLYFMGRWLADATGFEVLAWSDDAEQGSLLYDPARHRDVNDSLARTATQVFVNGAPINTDADTFEVVRWMPGSLLIYRDKNGEHEYTIGDEEKNCRVFDIRSDSVTWLKRPSTVRTRHDCVVETLEGVDPEYFYRLTERVGIYKDRVYLVKFSPLEPDAELSIVSPKEFAELIDEYISPGERLELNIFLNADGQLFRKPIRTRYRYGDDEDGENKAPLEQYIPASGHWIPLRNITNEEIELLIKSSH
ncbi:hypothetical protein G163CM_04870 [Pseudocitrobacter corydidari]|uniref:DKNYY family protein n=2 Tax=Pseudocitrobacter corydidari TaxID=2891570 RepID=A0ABY3S198_9ENTR|nr:hypothetical protein G163CM_04870 [Pseudocitrobacter corydidari]